MLKAIGFIFVLYVALSLLGATPQHFVLIDGVPLTPWASSLMAVGAAVVATIIVVAVVWALIAGLMAMIVGGAVFVLVLVLCAIFAPFLVPVIILMAMVFLCTLGGVFA